MKHIYLKLQENQKEKLDLHFPKETELDITVDLLGDRSELVLRGAFDLKKDSTTLVTLVINHIGKDTKSDTIIKAVLQDQATGSFKGLVNIYKGAVNTQAYLKEDALLLSPNARAEAIPSLEIDENHVKAGHSSTVQPLDEEQLFYFQSRGIDRQSAKKILKESFLSSALQ